jgi:hypothetical protein
MEGMVRAKPMADPVCPVLPARRKKLDMPKGPVGQAQGADSA